MLLVVDTTNVYSAIIFGVSVKQRGVLFVVLSFIKKYNKVLSST